jgi:hypothetical protein
MWTIPYQPFVDLKFKGIERRWGTLWWGERFTITSDTIGRQLFGAASEFWNPDLPAAGNYKEFVAAGQRLFRGVMNYAHKRGMECTLVVPLTDYPPEFAPLLNSPEKINQLNQLSVVPGRNTSASDPKTAALAVATLQTAVNTYPEADRIYLGAPEHRQWSDQYQEAWRVLDKKYSISKVRPLTDVLAAAGNRKDYPGGAERAINEVKGDLVSLYFYDRLLDDLHALRDTRRPDLKIVYGQLAEELFPVLGKILPPGSEMLNLIDYTPARILRRRAVIQNAPVKEVPVTLIYTLEDDNIGLMPQLTTGSLHQLTGDLARSGWAGFSTRTWLIGDKDPCVSYLARASWDRGATPDAVYRDFIRAACGSGCVDDMLEVFREVEAVTVSLELNNLSFCFTVPEMLMQHWQAGPMSAELQENRRGYQRALAAAKRARAKTVDTGRGYVDYWVGRMEFAVEYMNTVDAMHRAAIAERKPDLAEAVRETESALGSLTRSIEAYARVARGQCDRGAIAELNKFAYRPLKAKLATLRGQAKK